jgi:hypothetical protein
MSRYILTALLLGSALMPLPATAQNNQNSSTSITDYGQQFLQGQSEEEKEKENKSQKVWQYNKKYKTQGGLGHGAYITQETVNEGGKSKKKLTYNAVSQYDPVLKAYMVHKNNGLPLTAGEMPQSLLPTGEQFVYFVRTPDEKSNEAILRLVTPVSVSGCMNMIPPTVAMRQGAGMLAFKIQSGDVALDKSVRYAHYQCHQGSNVAFADIKLNRDELMRKKIKALTFQSEGGGMDTYNIEWSGDKLTLLPKTAFAFKPFEGSGRADPLSHYFYPDNAIVLYAPAAAKDADLEGPIENLAMSKGLTRASVPGADYFIDQQKILSGSLAFGSSAYVGTINAREKFQGPNGPYDQEKPLDIYARRPGMLD